MAARGLTAATAVVLSLTACSTPPPAPAVTRAATQPAPSAGRTAEQAQPVGTRMPPPAMTDMCKAQGLQWLVGRPRSEIPIAADIVNRRVVCTTCPVTEDYSPYRLNIFFNAETDRVELVRCG